MVAYKKKLKAMNPVRGDSEGRGRVITVTLRPSRGT